MTKDKITWTNVKVQLSQLKAWSDNPRYSTKSQAERLMASWERFGQVETIAIDPDYNLLNGHQRLSALMTLHGADYEVDARQSSRCLTDDERRALVIVLHSGAVGAWDWELLSGWNAPDLIAWGMGADVLQDWKRDVTALDAMLESEKPVVDAEPQTDRADELQKKWGTATGQLWALGDHRLLCGDSVIADNYQKLMGDKLVNMIWTDPPYGVNYGDKLEAANPMHYRVRQIKNDDLAPDKLEEFLRSVLKNAADASVPGAAIYVASPAGTLLPALIAAFAGSGFDYHWGLIWLKDQIVLSRADYHFKHENILYGWKPGAAHYFTPSRTQASVFEYPRPKRSDEHPTMKPIELIQHMVRNSSKSGDVVLDMFGGSGSTMVACENEKRICMMLELDEKYCAVILERMATAFPSLKIELTDA